MTQAPPDDPPVYLLYFVCFMIFPGSGLILLAIAMLAKGRTTNREDEAAAA